MGIVTWPIQEARKIIKAAKTNEEEFILETGYGPSGLPHIGTFGEVVRTSFVIQALKLLKPEAKVTLIAFSDDMDGLRKLPDNIPNHDLLQPHLGEPLSSIPDPYQEEESFGSYMNKRLQHFLNSFGFSYEFYSSTECYRSGVFDEGLKKVMDNYEKIRNIFVQTIALEKRDAWSPFFPICQFCGKINSTRVTEIDTQNYRVSYVCDQDGERFKSCGHHANVPITGGNLKVGWKVDWALRWYALGINYEMYGKDLMESATMSAKICRILGGVPPVPYKYELFLDETGAKISKTVGNGLSMEQWMRYAPFGALLNFLVGNPNKARKMGPPLLPRLIDEYLQALRTQTSSEVESSLWYLAKVQNQGLSEHNEIKGELGFSLLYNVAESLSISDPELLYEYAVKYEPEIQSNSQFFKDLCKNVVDLVSDNKNQKDGVELSINSAYLPLLTQVRERLLESPLESIDGTELQKFLFLIAKENDINPRDWFEFLYQILLGKNQGPKIGPFFAMLGKEKSISLIDDSIQS
ncbi:MAG: lysine--tRNA ligase [Proteobacteria bacterium]|nr:lysine--tRNA ligase [Pseudomonadota bacterium]